MFASWLRAAAGLERKLRTYARGLRASCGGEHDGDWSAGCGGNNRLGDIMPVDVDREAVARLVAAGAQLVEVLPREEYEPEHLPGAINLPLKELNRRSANRLDRGRAVIAYCHDFQ